MSADCPRDWIALGFYAVTAVLLVLAVIATRGHKRQ